MSDYHHKQSMEQQIATPSQQIVTLSAQLEELYKLEESLYPRSKNGNPKLRNHALRKIEAIWDGVGVTGVLDCWFPYVAMELFDRLPPLVNEDVDLVVVSCLTLACKMQKKKFHTTEFLLKCGLNYSLEEHVAMELRILRLLEWKMRPLTPFCFAKGFSHMLPASCDPRLVHRIILWAQCDDRLVQFKPSILALSASVCSCSSADDKAAIRDLGKQMCKNKKDDFELLKRCIGLMETAYPLDKCQSKHKASEEDSLMKLKLEWIEQMQPSEDGVGMCSLYQQALGWICRLC